MTDSVLRRLVIARAKSVEPIAHALCPEVPQTTGQPFSRSRDRWRETAVASGWSACDATSLPYGLTHDEIYGRRQDD